ncbi:hypothetical protein ATANTOWER_026566 [Ataeniobius toweri]|uniref:Uncharacterized protein n=1 Tax=Ataeniobius toweri TaxID=208326 RepID=A0ABU7ARE7_9TELE|nr:hypothetical protein [Ataeniobius toweri]
MPWGLQRFFHISKIHTQKMIVNITMILRPILAILLGDSRLSNTIPMMVYVCVRGQISRTTRRESLLVGGQVFGREGREALSVIRHSTDKSVVKEKMRATFEYRQKLVHDPDATSSVLDVFPRFLDTPGLIDQDFSMMLGDDVSERFLTQWPSYFKEKVMAESKSLPSSPCVEELRASFDPELTDDYGWDSDVAALLFSS